MFYHFKIHKEAEGYWAECIEISGCVTQGETKEELFENMEEAINIFLEEPEDSKFLAPLPKKGVRLTRTVVKVPVDPEVAFGFTVRYHRIKKGLTQKQAAKRLEMKNVYSYQRLEKRCNATLDMIGKLMALYPNISVDRLFK